MDTIISLFAFSLGYALLLLLAGRFLFSFETPALYRYGITVKKIELELNSDAILILDQGNIVMEDQEFVFARLGQWEHVAGILMVEKWTKFRVLRPIRALVIQTHPNRIDITAKVSTLFFLLLLSWLVSYFFIVSSYFGLGTERLLVLSGGVSVVIWQIVKSAEELAQDVKEHIDAHQDKYSLGSTTTKEIAE